MWSALLQSHGQLKTLATSQIISAVISLFAGLPAIYYFGTKGIAASILLSAAAPAIVTWRASRLYCQQASVEPDKKTTKELIHLGGALMIVILAAQLSAYGIRYVIIGQEGLAAAGYYQAAFAIAGSLPGFVFMAMSADFFPRIAGAKDETEAQYLTEKQIQAGILLALPFLVVLVTMGKPCIRLLYAESFDPAISLLPWMVWGVFFRLISWPMGYWMLARGSPQIVIMVEISANLILVLMPMFLMPIYGLSGAAIGYFISYSLYSAIMMGVSYQRSGKRLSMEVFCWIIMAGTALLISQLFSSQLDGEYWGLIPTLVITTACTVFYLKTAR